MNFRGVLFANIIHYIGRFIGIFDTNGQRMSKVAKISNEGIEEEKSDTQP